MKLIWPMTSIVSLVTRRRRTHRILISGHNLVQQMAIVAKIYLMLLQHQTLAKLGDCSSSSVVQQQHYWDTARLWKMTILLRDATFLLLLLLVYIFTHSFAKQWRNEYNLLSIWKGA